MFAPLFFFFFFLLLSKTMFHVLFYLPGRSFFFLLLFIHDLSRFFLWTNFLVLNFPDFAFGFRLAFTFVIAHTLQVIKGVFRRPLHYIPRISTKTFTTSSCCSSLSFRPAFSFVIAHTLLHTNPRTNTKTTTLHSTT